jgi:hypothetical protein
MNDDRVRRTPKEEPLVVWRPHQLTQLGYVCRNLEDAISYFVENQGAGPFFTMEVPAGAATYTYRGSPVGDVAKNRVAFGYRGPIQFELIESDNPIFDHLRRGGDMVFHHCMQMTNSFEADRARYAKAGYSTMGVAEMPGVLIHYVDTLEQLGHYTELFDYDAAIRDTGGEMFKLFEVMHETSQRWDGKMPIRRLEDLMR